MIQRDEQRVIEALRAFTGGLTVTDQDITTAESRLRDSLEPPSPRRRLAILAAAVAAVLVVGFFVSRAIDRDTDSAPPVDRPSPAGTLKAALQADAYAVSSADFSAGAQPTARDLAGFWMLREPYGATMFVDAAGNWAMGYPTAPAVSGPSTLDGATWTRRLDDRGICAKGNDMIGVSQSWHAALAADGSLRLDLNASRASCTPADNREVWDRVAPGSPVADYLLAVAQRADWQPAPRSFRWLGLFVAPATGRVLEVTDDEQYRYYDTLTDASLVAADQGDVSSDGAGTTGSCSEGSFAGSVEVALLPGVADYLGSYDAVRFTPTTDNCASSVAAHDVWVKVSG
jgi:hypothetical protein